jgi:hypothetical protein
MQQFSLSKDEVLALVRELIAEHAIEPRFRIQTDRLIVDYENTWKEELVQLPDIVTDEDGRRISALEPSSIEVGYVRVSSVE